MLLHTKNNLIPRACAVLMGACFILSGPASVYSAIPIEASQTETSVSGTAASTLELRVDVKIDAFTNLRYNYDILVFSADLKTCYGPTPCQVRPGETVNISINPIGADYGLRYFYDFPTGVDGSFYTAVVPEDGHITIELEPYDTGADIYGYVTDIDGKPICGATVAVTMSAYGDMSESVLTDSYGSYKLSNISDRDNATLIVSCSGYLTSVTGLNAMELRSTPLLKYNVQLEKRTPAFRLKLINKWDDPRIADLLFDELWNDAASSLTITTSDGSPSDCLRVHEDINSDLYLPITEADSSATYRISCSNRYFNLSSRSVRHGGTIEITSQPVGAVSLLTTAADPYADIFCCLYDLSGRLSAYSRITSGKADILLDPGYYTLVLYSAGAGLTEPYDSYAEMEMGLRNCYCMSVSIEDGHIIDLGSLEAPQAVYTYDPYMIELDSVASASLITISAPASTATGYIACEGTAPADSLLYIYDGDSLICTTHADRLGHWNAFLSLASTAYPLSTHMLSAGISGARSKTVNVIYDPSRATACDIYPVSEGIRLSTRYTESSDTVLAFEAAIENHTSLTGTPVFHVLCSDGSLLALDAHITATSYSAAGVSVATYLSEAFNFGQEDLTPVRVWFNLDSSSDSTHPTGLATDMPSVIAPSGSKVTGLKASAADAAAYASILEAGDMSFTIDDSDGQSSYESFITCDDDVITVWVHSLSEDTYHSFSLNTSAYSDSTELSNSCSSVSMLDPASLKTHDLTISEMQALLATLADTIYITGSGDIRLTTAAISSIDSAITALTQAYDRCDMLMKHADAATLMLDAIEYRSSAVIGVDADELTGIICAQISGEYEYAELCYAKALSQFSRAIRDFMLATDLSLDNLIAQLASTPDDESIYNLAQTLYSIALSDSFGTALHPITPAMGVVYEAVASNHINGASVTLYRYSSDDHFDTYGHINPYVTGSDGAYGWELAEGDYYVKAILAGYRAGSSQNNPSATNAIDGINYIPAARMSGIDIAVTSTSPAHATISCKDGTFTLEFDRYIYLDTFTRSNISFRINGHRISTFVLEEADDFVPGFLSSAVLLPLDAELSPATTPLCGGQVLARRFSLTFPDGFGPEDVLSVTFGEGLMTYNGLSAAGTLEINVPGVSEISDPVFLETASNSHMPIWMIASIVLIVVIIGGVAFYIYTHRKNF